MEPGRFNFTSGQARVEIPFYTFNNQVILSVKVNDKVDLNFILDSGTPQAVFFDRKLAQKLGIGFGRKIQFSGVGNHNYVTAFRTRGVKLALPGVEGYKMGMAVLSSDFMDMQRFDIHGIIGYQLFVRFAVKIDYQRRILTLMEPDQYSTKGFQAFSMQLENSKPYMNSEVRLNDNQEVSMKLMIDTGAAYGLSLITGTHPAVKAPAKSKKVRLGSGLGGEMKGFKGWATLILNDELNTEVETFYVKPKDYSRKGIDSNKMGTIGANLLNRYTVIIDYINSKILFQPINTTNYLSETKT